MGLIVKKKMGHTAELTLSENFHDYFHLDIKKGEKKEGEKAEENKEKGAG